MPNVSLTIELPSGSVPTLLDYIKGQYDPAEIENLSNKQLGEKYIEDHFFAIYESITAAEAGRAAQAAQAQAIADKEAALEAAQQARKSAEAQARADAAAEFGRA